MWPITSSPPACLPTPTFLPHSVAFTLLLEGFILHTDYSSSSSSSVCSLASNLNLICKSCFKFLNSLTRLSLGLHPPCSLEFPLLNYHLVFLIPCLAFLFPGPSTRLFASCSKKSWSYLIPSFSKLKNFLILFGPHTHLLSLFPSYHVPGWPAISTGFPSSTAKRSLCWK